MTVEYLTAKDDGLWDTHIEEVPLETENRESLVAWAEEHLGRQARFRNVVLWALYSIHQDEEEEEEDHD